MRTLLVYLALAGSVSGADEVVVRLTDNAVVPLTVKGPARAQVVRMFAGAGIRLAWSTDRSVQRPISVDLNTDTPAEVFPGALASTSLAEGRVIVFYDRIAGGFGRAAAGNAEVLAHVMVHEIAHVLQGVARHSETGIMKARWSLTDYSQMRFKALTFTPVDISLLLSGAAARAQR